MGIPFIGDLIGGVKDIVSEVVVDKDKRNEINYKLKELEDKAEARLHEERMGQIETNKAEAQHSSIFVAGWRPFIGWTAGAGVAWTFVIAPLVEWISRIFGWTGAMPELDVGQLMALITALLGLGTLRTVEKVKEVARGTISQPEIKKEEAEASPSVQKLKPKKRFTHFKI